ncbi:MAG: efflux RND transporter periplasmic adaptor subunit [Vicinamibacterales bacterium]
MARARQEETAERLAVVDSDARVDETARAEAAVRLARAEVAEARALLQKTVVRAPIDGVVLRRHKRAGESVSLDGPSPAVVTVADIGRLRVRVDVDETDVADLHVGQHAWVTAPAYGDTRFRRGGARGHDAGAQERAPTNPPRRRTPRCSRRWSSSSPARGCRSACGWTFLVAEMSAATSWRLGTIEAQVSRRSHRVAAFERHAHEPAARAHPGLREQLLQRGLDGTFGHAQLRADLLVRAAFEQEPHDLRSRGVSFGGAA